MKKLVLLLILNSFISYAMEEGNETELHIISATEEREFCSAESENSSPINNQDPCNQEKKSKSCCWSLTKRILIGSLLASQAIGLATDVVGMQQSQQLNALASPILAYDGYHWEARANCSYLEDAPLPNYVREISCNCSSYQKCTDCVIETCPGGQEYITHFTGMYASQITAITTRVLTLIGILGSALGCAWDCSAGGFTFK